MLKNRVSRIREDVLEHTEQLAEHTGDFLERSIGNRIADKYEAPCLEGSPKLDMWYRIPIEEGISGDGSEYHIYMKKRRTKKLCIFLSGGGVAWSKEMAAAPVTGGRVVAGQPNYYWSNLRPFTQIMNINIGITENRQRNPFHSWNFGVITYATGDFHLGNNCLTYEDENGKENLLHFAGYENFRHSMDKIKELFPNPEHLLIAGDSAGAFATPILAEEILTSYYPDCKDVSIFSDSAMIKRNNWEHTLKNVWNAPEFICKAQHSDNITVDFYENLMKKMGDRCKYFYASSIEDYLLSSFQNEIDCGVFETNAQAQQTYFENLKEMHHKLQALPQPMSFFYYDWRSPILTKGGTVHTAIRQPFYYQKSQGVATMAKWLWEGVNGHSFDVGINLLMMS